MDAILLKPKSERLNVPISAEQKEQIRRYADRHGLSMASVVRLMVSNLLGENLISDQVPMKGEQNS